MDIQSLIRGLSPEAPEDVNIFDSNPAILVWDLAHHVCWNGLGGWR